MTNNLKLSVNLNVFSYLKNISSNHSQQVALLIIIVILNLFLLSNATNPCSINQFQCVSEEKCIALSQKCDSFKDCKDGSDEKNCPKENCQGNVKKFECRNKRCIPKEWICDGENDCDEHEDEENCADCPPHMFACSNHTCIEKSRIKDNITDCEDGIDESIMTFIQMGCSDSDIMFECDNKHCIYNSLVCDGKNHCGDNSDEDAERCNKTFTEDFFLEQNNLFNCSNDSDEDDCKTCPSGQFQCLNENCIDNKFRCDGKDDCDDLSDEYDCPEKLNTTQKNFYNHDLLHSCDFGYHWEPEMNRCEDNDECIDDYSICSGQECQNKPGSYDCICSVGYTIQNKNTCRSNSKTLPTIYFAEKNGRIEKFKLDVQFKNKSQIELVFSAKKEEIILFDLNVHHNYYVGASTDGVMLMDGLDKKRPSFHMPDVMPDIYVDHGQNIRKITLDWLNHVVFYINYNRIMAIKLAKFQQKMTLIQTHIHDPLDIKVNPLENWFVWSDGGNKNSSAKIEKVQYDGYQRKIIFRNSNELLRPICLCIDFATERIFWFDSTLGTIGSLKYDGDSRQIVYQSFYEPLGIDVFDNLIFWFTQNTIHASDKFDNIDSFYQIEIHEKNYSFNSFRIIHELRQPILNNSKFLINQTNACIQDCPYICLNGHCICPRYHIRYQDSCLTSKQYHFIIANIPQARSRDVEEYFYIIASIITILIVIVFIAPYLWHAFVSRFRMIKQNQQYQCMMTQIPRKSIINTLLVAGTTVVTRTDDVSSGYASISEQNSINNHATFDDDDDDDDNDDDNDDGVDEDNDNNHVGRIAERRVEDGHQDWYTAV